MKSKLLNFKLIFIAIIFLGIFGMAKSSLAATVTCNADCGTTCSASSVQSAVNTAGAGGTVNIPAGACTWTGSVNLTRGIKIVGAGSVNTNITRTDTIFLWDPSNTAITNGEIFELSGVTLNGNGGDNIFTLSGPIPSSSAPTLPALVYIHDNLIKNGGQGSGNLFQISGDVFGAIRDNTFDRVCRFMQWLADSGGYYCGGYYHWLYHTSWQYGEGDSLYIEHNNMQYSSSDSACVSQQNAYWTEFGWGVPGVVIRYNTYDFTNLGAGYTETWDVHGHQGTCSSDQCSTQKAEIYGNFLLNRPSGRIQNDRGSWLIQFNNRITGSSVGIDLNGNPTTMGCDGDDACQSLLPGRVQNINNTYFWNNMENGANIAASPYDSGSMCGEKENNNYFNYNPSCTSSACSSGVGVGSATPTGSCTMGVGYWKWSQGTTLPTTMDEMIVSTQAGTFYKCTAPNTWTAYYTPYIYPHPLQGISGSDTIPPAVPTGVIVN